MNGNDNNRIFTALRFMDGDGISQFQFFQLGIIVIHHFPIIENHLHGFVSVIDLSYHARIAVKYAYAFITAFSHGIIHAPRNIIVIFDLHDLVPFPEDNLTEFFFRSFLRRRIQSSLQNGVEILHT